MEGEATGAVFSGVNGGGGADMSLSNLCLVSWAFGGAAKSSLAVRKAPAWSRRKKVLGVHPRCGNSGEFIARTPCGFRAAGER